MVPCPLTLTNIEREISSRCTRHVYQRIMADATCAAPKIASGIPLRLPHSKTTRSELQLFCKQQVWGSSPQVGSTKSPAIAPFIPPIGRIPRRSYRNGRTTVLCGLRKRGAKEADVGGLPRCEVGLRTFCCPAYGSPFMAVAPDPTKYRLTERARTHSVLSARGQRAFQHCRSSVTPVWQLAAPARRIVVVDDTMVARALGLAALG